MTEPKNDKNSFGTVKGLRAFRPRESGPFEVKDEKQTGGYVRINKNGTLAYVLKYRFDHLNKKMR